MTSRTDLTALIGSRICHDLISPIGAIGNGVELLMMSGGANRGPEVALIAESVSHANARIRFFRIAFGAAGQDARIGRPEVSSILADLMNGSRQSVEWTSPADMARQEVKLAFLAIMCGETAMPFGGRMRVERGETRWTVQGVAARMRIDPDLWDVLSNPGNLRDITPGEVHFALLAEEIARLNRRLAVELREGEVRIGF
jgi:histidine phosphotransferase ChpT